MHYILVTGINGFVGHHVARHLALHQLHIMGIGEQSSIATDLSEIVPNFASCDLTSQESVAKIDLKNISSIINLAGFAKVGDSRGQGELYNRVNIGVHTVLYDECLRQGVSPRIIAVSTGAVYDPTGELPLSEESALIDKAKTNEYVISKQLMEEALDEYRRKGLDIITARPFNHSGPGQLPGFLIPDLAGEIELAVQTKSPLKVGNLKTKRDYTDVRDVAEAYIALATAPRDALHSLTYNICSGSSVAGERILELLKKSYGIENLEIEVDPLKLRSNDIADIYGSSTKLQEDTGWKPKISVEQMIKDFVEWKTK